ncbi:MULTISPECIES: hypothetical protein [unclassified Cryobacterium]|uniref:hypothetical protein n=1 Tax=unclassified Cryobacterium TaxID=2649013 RepID=UPI001069DC73|nr:MULTISPECIES: hypothetical protein [unclassified Cryobacterium]TFC53912.1 hypothetical protein E3O68_09770 [Cryobacterium sp. TMB3-1-2]TFC73799.1 hypothetical protein E3T21_03960 [Cryobacterium sp. TMB3-15]TFC77669.1 hypothetical protein E3T22_04810 [Cryobacterium sp. TMB3-10]TFD39797.1 hypothetical protein E3T58_14605 [Cryobacterium sp. TMB3-12]
MTTTSSGSLDVLAALSGHSGLILASDAARVGLHHELRREYERHTVIRLRRGVYTRAAEWDALGADARYLRRIHAHAATAEAPAVYSHVSAAALWGLPIVGAWPADIHLATTTAAGGRSRRGVIRHPQEHSLDVVEHEGLRVTSVAATAVALARVLRFGQAVAVVDKAIHQSRDGHALATRADLDRAFDQLGRVTGRAAAGRVLEFASPLSGSSGESISRAGIFLLGFLLPELQVPHWDHAGLIGFTDFFWRSVGRVGEFDGHGKYLRDEFTGGRSTADIVMAEKIREDRLRALGLGVFRWDWSVATSLPALGDLLTRNGIPRAR